MEEKRIIEMRGIYKKFGNVNALNGVDLDLREGEVLGLVGDNAAGKSTLCKILFKIYKSFIFLKKEPYGPSNKIKTKCRRW